MATALFINRTDLVRNSIMDGNVDTDKFIQFIKIAQEIDVQQIMGTTMYAGLTTAIPNLDSWIMEFTRLDRFRGLNK